MPATETATADCVPWRSPVLVAVLAATLVTPMDVPLVGPALPAIGAAFSVSASRAGLFVTGYALPGVLLAPVVGMVATASAVAPSSSAVSPSSAPPGRPSRSRTRSPWRSRFASSRASPPGASSRRSR